MTQIRMYRHLMLQSCAEEEAPLGTRQERGSQDNLEVRPQARVIKIDPVERRPSQRDQQAGHARLRARSHRSVHIDRVGATPEPMHHDHDRIRVRGVPHAAQGNRPARGVFHGDGGLVPRHARVAGGAGEEAAHVGREGPPMSAEGAHGRSLPRFAEED